MKSLRIIGKQYVVSGNEDLPNAGECDYKKQVIEYLPRQHKDQIRDTLLHEVIHAVDHSLDLDLTEKQVHGLAGGLYAVFRDNPEFVSFLMED